MTVSRRSSSVNLVSVRGTALLPKDNREQYRQKLARITLDSMVQFVGLLDAQGTVLEINQVALDGVGIKLSDVEGKPFWTTFWWQVSEDINATLRESIRRAAQGEFVRWDAEIYGRASGKETITIDASLMPVKDDQGNVVFITAEGRDITEKKAHEREIARQREELAKLDELKTQFFANISHEFRTPLTLMIGPLEDALARSDAFSPEDREHLDLAHRNSLRLLKLVNALLEFSRIEAGRIQASYEPCDLTLMTSELASMFRSAIERAGMRLVLDCPALPEPVYVDREMWEKIVLNLLSNALKFTFEGEIAVSLRQVGDAVEMTVRDTGTGIPKDEIPRLFERFHRVVGARGRSYEGSGIGLALVQELVKLHGGEVSIQSEVDRGTTFSVTLPLGKEHLPPDRIEAVRTPGSTAVRGEAYVEEALHWLPAVQTTGNGDKATSSTLPVHDSRKEEKRSRILLADDNADMREYIQRLLSDRYEVIAVEDGKAAMESARKRRPDLILSDIMMPRVDGIELLREIRADLNLKSIPVILVSARAGEESRVDGLEAGADDYLVKPFSARELLARVGSHLAMADIRRQTDRASTLLSSIVASSDDAIISKTLDGIITSWNGSAERLFGYSEEEAIGKSITLIIPPDRLDEEPKIIERLKRGERIEHFETARRRKDGSLVEISLTVSPLRDQAGNVIGASKVARDISARKEAEGALAEKSRLLNLSTDAIIVRSVDGRITYWNMGASELYGYSPDEAIGCVSHGLLQTTFPEPRDLIEEKLHHDDRWAGELTHKRKDGKAITVSSRWVLDRDSSGNAAYILETNNDITRQKDSEQQLQNLAATLESKVSLRTQELEARSSEVFDLSMQLLRAQDDERRYIARELHDTAGQTMTVIGMKLQRLVKTAKEAAPQLASESETIRSLIEKLNQDIRTTSYILHPPLLDESGLAPSLGWYVRGLSERSGLDIRLNISENLGRLPQDMELVIFRLIQECLTNVHRHADSSTAIIRIIRSADKISVQVQDKGKGMTPDRLRQVRAQGAGVGIKGMRERVRQFNGQMLIESDAGGTTVSATFPIESKSLPATECLAGNN
jgi:PAS domain S-box-containing protein